MSARRSNTGTAPFRVSGCDCLTCRSAAEKGFAPTEPACAPEAFIQSLRPLTRESRFLVSARIRGDQVLGVSVHSFSAGEPR